MIFRSIGGATIEGTFFPWPKLQELLPADFALFCPTGIDVTEVLEDVTVLNDPDTPFGKPSSDISVGTWRGSKIIVAVIERHDNYHKTIPTVIPNRANIFALRMLTMNVLAPTTVGSLSGDIEPGKPVLPHQLWDKTTKRKTTFYDEGECAVHVKFADPFCNALSAALLETAKQLDGYEDLFYTGDLPVGYVCMEGPQFSTRLESLLHQKLLELVGYIGIIGMTTAPEAKLSRDAGLHYVPIALPVDEDAWSDEEVDLTVIIKNVGTCKKTLFLLLDAFFQGPAAAAYLAAQSEASCYCADAPQIGLHTKIGKVKRVYLQRFLPWLFHLLGGK